MHNDDLAPAVKALKVIMKAFEAEFIYMDAITSLEDIVIDCESFMEGNTQPVDVRALFADHVMENNRLEEER